VAKRVEVRFRKNTSALFFWLLAVAGLGVFFAVTTVPTLSRNLRLNQQVEKLEEENTKLRERLEHLRLEEQALRSDPFYNETLIRREFGLVPAGERILWTPPTALAQETGRYPFAAGSTAPADSEPSWPLLSSLGRAGGYITRALDRLASDPAARRDGVLMALALLTAAFLVFGRQEEDPLTGNPHGPRRRRTAQAARNR